MKYVLTERKNMVNNLTVYLEVNGYTKHSFARTVHMSETTLKMILMNKKMKSTTFKRYIEKIGEQLELPLDYFARPQEQITKDPIHYYDENKLQIGNERMNVLSLLLKIGEIHYG